MLESSPIAWNWIFSPLLLLALFGTVVAAEAAPPRADFFIATNGNDAWSGTLAAPNKAKTDGPFATVARAQKALREKKTGTKQVLIRGGFYSLDAPLLFTEADSGTEATPILFAAYPGERPILSGGVRLTGFKTVGRQNKTTQKAQIDDRTNQQTYSTSFGREPTNRWELALPEATSGKWQFSQLYVNGQRRYRPRLPKQGFYFIAGEYPATERWQGKGFDRFRFKAGDLRPDWQNRDDIEVLPFHVWTMSRFKIADLDTTENIVTFTRGTRNAASFSKMGRGSRYLVDNVKEALTDAGEWYLDRKTGVLTYLAMKGENPDRTEVIAPRLERLIEMNGTCFLTLRGITFAHAAWNIGPEGNSSPQAEVNVPGALLLNDVRDCALEECTIRNIGNYALELTGGTKRVRIVGCEMIDLGAGGVKIGAMRYEADDEKVTSHITVRDCLIAEGGRIHPAAVGVWIGHSPYNTIEHNEIVDLYYTGISPGWSWGYGPSGAHHNEIAYNHIHKIGQGVLSDMGGIYTLGVSEGTILHHNRIHDIDSFSYGGWGIYFDEGSTGIAARNNIAYNTKSAPFHQHYGTNNIVMNNILAFGREAQLMRTRDDNGGDGSRKDELSFTIRNNIILWKEGPLLGSNWGGTNFAMDHNLYWNTSGRPFTFKDATFEEWKARGFDRGSVIGDPLFIAPEKGDFRFRPQTAASRIAFVPIDTSRIGRLSGKSYSGNAPRAFPAPPPPAPPQPIVDGFEEAIAGQKPETDNLTISEEAAVPAANIRVTNETAATGKQSLKITDAAGQKARYNPHLYYRPSFRDGTATGKFALRIEPGTVCYHEWRDNNTPYRTGPSLRLDAEGVLYAGKQRLTELPQGRWITFEIICPLGEKANGTYDLIVRLPGRTPPMKFMGLPCVSGASFTALNWWGFVSDNDGPGVFYLDDISLLPSGAKR